MTAATDSQRQLVGFLETVPAAEFDRDRGIRFRGYKVTIGRLLQVEVEDEKVHHGQIMELMSKSREQGSPAERF